MAYGDPDFKVYGSGFNAVVYNRLRQAGVPHEQAVLQAGGQTSEGPAPYQTEEAELPPLSVDDEDDEETAGGLSGLGSPFSVKDASAARNKAQTAYETGYGNLMQRYQDAEEAIRQQRATSLTSPENLLALSAAFFSPTRSRGFGGTMANVLPVIQNAVAQRAEDERRKQQLLREYGMDVSKMQLGYLEKGLSAADRQYMAALKAAQPAKTHVSVNPVTGEPYDTSTGFVAPNAQQVGALLANPAMAAEFDKKFGPGAAARVMQMYGGRR